MPADARFEVSNATKETILASTCQKASNPISRGMGLIGRRGLPEGGGLIIEPSSGVVSFFMRFPIDVLFVDREGNIVHILPSMRPWRMSKVVRKSRLVVELPAGTCGRTGTEIGDVVEIRQL